MRMTGMAPTGFGSQSGDKEGYNQLSEIFDPGAINVDYANPLGYRLTALLYGKEAAARFWRRAARSAVADS